MKKKLGIRFRKKQVGPDFVIDPTEDFTTVGKNLRLSGEKTNRPTVKEVIVTKIVTFFKKRA